jgi:hypothetical protein
LPRVFPGLELAGDRIEPVRTLTSLEINRITFYSLSREHPEINPIVQKGVTLFPQAISGLTPVDTMGSSGLCGWCLGFCLFCWSLVLFKMGVILIIQ